MGQADRNNDAKGHGGGSSGGRGSSGAGSDQSANQGRGGQADVGGKSSATGDSADNGSREQSARDRVNSEYGVTEADVAAVKGMSYGEFDSARSRARGHLTAGRVSSTSVKQDPNSYSLSRDFNAKEKEGALSPKEHETNQSIRSGYRDGLAGNTIGSMLGGTLTKAMQAIGLTSGVPQVDSLAGGLLSDTAMKAMSPKPMDDYGYAVGQSAAKPTVAETAANVGLGMAVHPVVGTAVSTGMNISRNKDIVDGMQANEGKTVGPTKDNEQSQTARSRAIASLQSPSAPQSAKSPSQYYSTRPDLSGYTRA